MLIADESSEVTSKWKDMEALALGTRNTHRNLIVLGDFPLPLLFYFLHCRTNSCMLMFHAGRCTRDPFFGSVCCVWAVGGSSRRAEFPLAGTGGLQAASRSCNCTCNCLLTQSWSNDSRVLTFAGVGLIAFSNSYSRAHIFLLRYLIKMTHCEVKSSINE